MKSGFWYAGLSLVGLILITIFLLRGIVLLPRVVTLKKAPQQSAKKTNQPVSFGETITASTSASIKLPILLYHYVEYVKDPKDIIRISLDIRPDLFERQAKAITQAGYQTYFVKDMPAILDGKLAPAAKSVILTFDDGYEDFYTDALPLLRKYNLKATLYVMYDFIGRKGYLNHDQIQKIIDSGLVEIGSHTLDHAYLKGLSASIARREIVDNKQKLEETFGIQVSTFAYPYGAFDDQAVRLVKEASYTAAVSVISGRTQSKNNLFSLSRIRAGVATAGTLDHVLQTWKN